MQSGADVIPVSQLWDKHELLFAQITRGPIILVQHGQPVAMLVSVRDGHECEKRLEILEAQARYLEIKQQFCENPPKLFSFAEIEARVEALRCHSE